MQAPRDEFGNSPFTARKAVLDSAEPSRHDNVNELLLVVYSEGLAVLLPANYLLERPHGWILPAHLTDVGSAKL